MPEPTDETLIQKHYEVFEHGLKQLGSLNQKGDSYDITPDNIKIFKNALIGNSIQIENFNIEQRITKEFIQLCLKERDKRKKSTINSNEFGHVVTTILGRPQKKEGDEAEQTQESQQEPIDENILSVLTPFLKSHENLIRTNPQDAVILLKKYLTAENNNNLLNDQQKTGEFLKRYLNHLKEKEEAAKKENTQVGRLRTARIQDLEALLTKPPEQTIKQQTTTTACLPLSLKAVALERKDPFEGSAYLVSKAAYFSAKESRFTLEVENFDPNEFNQYAQSLKTTLEAHCNLKTGDNLQKAIEAIEAEFNGQTQDYTDEAGFTKQQRIDNLNRLAELYKGHTTELQTDPALPSPCLIVYDQNKKIAAKSELQGRKLRITLGDLTKGHNAAIGMNMLCGVGLKGKKVIMKEAVDAHDAIRAVFHGWRRGIEITLSEQVIETCRKEFNAKGENFDAMQQYLSKLKDIPNPGEYSKELGAYIQYLNQLKEDRTTPLPEFVGTILNIEVGAQLEKHLSEKQGPLKLKSTVAPI